MDVVAGIAGSVDREEVRDVLRCVGWRSIHGGFAVLSKGLKENWLKVVAELVFGL